MNDMIMVTIIEAMIIVLLQGILLLFPNKKTKKFMPHITLEVALLLSAVNYLEVLCR